jgi:hypothetical protein
VRENPDAQIFAIHFQYIELANDSIRDMLREIDRTSSLVIRGGQEKRFSIANISIRKVNSIYKLFKYRTKSKCRRQTRTTRISGNSSSSQSIRTLTIGGRHGSTRADRSEHVWNARLNFVGLASSARVLETHFPRQRFPEGISIDRTLLILRICDSPLTKLP